jgi:hypothetical protein
MPRFRLGSFVPRHGRRATLLAGALALAALAQAAPAAPLPLVNDPTFFTTEHVDGLFVSWSEGALTLSLSDDEAAVRHAPHEAFLWVGPAAKTPRAAGAAWNFVGTLAGSDVWVLPQMQDPDVLYFGGSGEGVPLGQLGPYVSSDPRLPKSAQAWIQVSLLARRGPGEVSIWQEDAFGQPIVWASTAENGIDPSDGIYLLPQAHLHHNLGFTQPGLYALDFRVQAFLGPGASNPMESEVYTYYFGVESVPRPGDMNADGAVDNEDISPFVLALVDQDAFAVQFPRVPPDLAGDMNGDWRLDNDDILGFVQRLVGGSAATVPEPATAALVGAAVLCAAATRGRRSWKNARPSRLIVDVGFQEPRQAVEIAAGFDVADDGHERFRIDERFEGDVVEVELA